MKIKKTNREITSKTLTNLNISTLTKAPPLQITLINIIAYSTRAVTIFRW